MSKGDDKSMNKGVRLKKKHTLWNVHVSHIRSFWRM